MKMDEEEKKRWTEYLAGLRGEATQHLTKPKQKHTLSNLLKSITAVENGIGEGLMDGSDEEKWKFEDAVNRLNWDRREVWRGPERRYMNQVTDQDPPQTKHLRTKMTWHYMASMIKTRRRRRRS
jgi:hypothetical protein